MVVLAAAGLAAYVGALVVAGVPARSAAAVPVAAGAGPLPAIEILPSHGVSTALNRKTARAITWDLVSSLGITPAKSDRVRVWLEPGPGQDPPLAVAQLSSAGRLATFKLKQAGARWAIDRSTGELQPVSQLPVVAPLPGFGLESVGPKVGLNFQQGSFRFGVTGDTPAMMGGGVCWLDYNNDGWLDLFAVNNYTDNQYADWLDHGGPPTGQLFRNDHGTFVNVTKAAHVGLPTRGEGCVAADFNGDGYTDLFVTTATDDQLFWNNGNGTFTEGARKAGVVSFGWHSGAAVTDVNGDGRPDLFVAGYTDLQHPIATSLKGFPGNYHGVPNELFLNLGHRHFRNVTKLAGLDDHPNDHSLGAVFLDVNGDGRPDLYVANDGDPNRLYLNEPAARSASTSSRSARRSASPTRTPAWASPQPTGTATAEPISSSPTRAARGTRRSARAARAFATRGRSSALRSERIQRAGATRGSTCGTTGSSTSSSRTAASR